MNRKIENRVKRIRTVAISFIISGVIVWFLLSQIDPRDIPRVIGKIPFWSLGIAFLFYTFSVFLKALRFRIILRTGISLGQLFPIVSLYMFFANVLPMRAGELSYIYLLKKQARTPGTKSFASLIIGGIADAAVVLLAMLVVGWHLRNALGNVIVALTDNLAGKICILIRSEKFIFTFIIAVILLTMGVIGLVMVRRKTSRQSYIRQYIRQYMQIIKSKVYEVGHELADTSFDVRLLGIITCSILIIAFRFVTQWYLIKSMGIGINIWEISFALLFGVLFSLVPVHGPAGLGTVEVPWVLALSAISDVPLKDIIASGFGLHIIIIIYCVILGFFGAVTLRFMPSGMPGYRNVRG